MTETSSTSETYLVTGYTRTYVSGTSGFDMSALIEAAVQIKLQPVDKLETEISENEATIAAYEEMQTYLLTLQDAVDSLRNAPGAAGTESVFEQMEAYLSSSDGSDASAYLGVSVEAGLDPASYDVEIQQLAAAHKVGSATQSARDDALGLSGSFDLGSEGGETATITVDSDMTLDDVADAINDSTETTGVQASVLKVSDDEYMLILTASETGQGIQYSTTSGDDIGQVLGLTDAGGAFDNELHAAQSAIFSIDGVTVERSTNTIDDVIDGVTLDLYLAAAETTFTVEVEMDYSSAKSAISDFVDAYNAYRTFALAQAEIDNGTVADTAVLFGDSILRGTNTDVYDALAQMSENDDGIVTALGNIGITFDSENFLEIDEDVLDTAILENFDDVRGLFEFGFDSSSDDLKVLRHDSEITPGTYTLDIVTDEDGNVTSVSVDGDDTLFTVDDGGVLVGAANGALAGLKLVYTGEEDASITVTLSEGIADLLYDSLETVADSLSGTIADAITTLEEENDTKEAKAAEYTEKAYDYEDYLIDYYATLEARIQQAKITLKLIEAIFSSNDD